jgi:sorting nexin-13
MKDDYQMCRDCLKQRKLKLCPMTQAEELAWEKNLWARKYKLNAEIIEAGLASEKGKQYGVYAVQVTRDDYDKKEKKWHIYRRYSDFYDFHQYLKSKWMMLNRIEFPGKHTFRTTDRMFLEKRMVALNKYLCSLLTMTMDPCFGESLQDCLLHFLEPGNYVVKKKHFTDKIDTLVNPLKQSVRSVTDAVKSVPDTFINTVDGFTKIFHTKASVSAGFIEANKVGASIDEADDNIPLRIILLLMDEVFDLKSRNQWLRRRIVAIIRQVLKAMLGDTINRRIVDYVAYLTSPVRVSGYLQNLQNSLWPGGNRISSKPARDGETKMRTRFAAKMSLLSSLSDELKHLIGSETTRRGLLCVFDLCQNSVLNKRFVLVLLEGILKTLFPDKPFGTVIQRLHFRSNRVGKHRPFLIPSASAQPPTTTSGVVKGSSGNAPSVSAPQLSPRGSRRRR